MYPSDEQPTQSLTTGSPAAPRRRLGRRGRIAAIGVAAAMLVAAGSGIGLAFADGGDHTDTMSAPEPSDHPVGTGAQQGKRDASSRRAWAQQYGKDRTTMPNLPDVASATPEQKSAAADLLARTESATAPYADPSAAQAAGFDFQTSLTRAEQRNPNLAQRLQQVDAGRMPARMPMLHVANRANFRDGTVLDPSAPEVLMYAYEGRDAWKLVGVMYAANESYPQAPPDPGGPITRWHYHGEHGGLMMHIFFVAGNDLAHAYALTMDNA